MKPNEFVKLAINTEAPVEPAVERLATLDTMELLLSALKCLIEDADDLDILKAMVYYGKSRREINVLDMPMLSVQDKVAAIERLKSPVLARLLHAGIGMATEAGEYLEALYNHIYFGAELDNVNLAEEIGDTQWYCALGSDALGIGLEEIQAKIIAKLKKRYPNKFTEKDAANRDLDAEREILEGK